MTLPILFLAAAQFYSVPAPEEGNYRVTVAFGGFAKPVTTTIKAELRRLMVEQLPTPKGEYTECTFIVNVRRPEYPGGVVKLKDRERQSEMWAWDDRITIEVLGDHPLPPKIKFERVTNLPTVYIAGDSTSTDQGAEPYNSWGQMITRFFKPDIAVANHGESGESLKSFIGENRLAKLMSVIKPGDWLLIQMGHNDQKDTSEGAGAFTTYKSNLKRFVTEAREHGAKPVLITPVQRLNFDGAGHIVNTLGDFPEAVRQLAKEDDVPLIDLNAMSVQFYEALGPAEAPKAFAPGDKTHHNDYGSYELAQCVAEGIRKAKLALADHLIKGSFDPAHPDPLSKFTLPPDGVATNVIPYGN